MKNKKSLTGKEKKEIRKIGLRAVKSAGEILLAYWGKTKFRMKSQREIVTSVDLLVEEKITQLIKKHFPDHTILGEEFSSSSTPTDYHWIIDPLDGTNNYAYHYPFFCTSIAFLFRRKIIWGTVYEPLRDELFEAKIGEGAFLNGKRIRVNSTRKLSQSRLLTGFYYQIEQIEDDNLKHFQQAVYSSLGVRVDGSAVLDLCYVATGRAEAYWEIGLKPWDMAAGKLLVEEAGGKVTDIYGKAFSLRKNNILATNGKIHGQMVKILTLPPETFGT
jgi:myo-inositol-1(or 4)-monophosphatase